MDYTKMQVLSALFFVLVGSVMCMSKECTAVNIIDCQSQYNININDCSFHKRIVACLMELESNCTDDKLITRVADAKKYNMRQAEACPGLPEGDCYFNALNLCQKDVPYGVAYSTTLLDEEKQKYCDKFNGKADYAKQCLRNVKDHCVSDRIHKQIDRNIKTIEKIEDKCGFNDKD